MTDIGNALVNIMQENDCSSVCALFALSEGRNNEQYVSTADVSEASSDKQRYNMGAGYRRGKGFSVNAQLKCHTHGQ